MAYISLLRERPAYRTLWLANVVSLLGDWFNTVATIAIVGIYTDSGLAVSGLFLARALPPFLLGPVAGMVVDKMDRKKVMIISDLSRAVVVLGYLLVTTREQLWILYVVTVLQFALSSFFQPAQNAILPSLVPRKDLVLANTLGSVTWSAMLTLGAVAGGIMTALFGVKAALIMDAGTFLLSALLVMRIQYDPDLTVDQPDVSTGGGWQAIRDGFVYVWGFPAVAVIVTIKGITQIGNVDILTALYAERVFPLGENGSLALGLMLAAHGLGAILGPVILNQFGDQSRQFLRLGILVGFISLPISLVSFGAAPTLLLAMLAMILRGVGGSINWTYSTILLQLNVPDHFLGRVFALDFALFTMMLSLTTWISGVAIDVWGITARQLSAYSGLISAVLVVGWGMYLLWRRNQPEDDELTAHPG